ncbi:hypothetical protein JWG45_14270 [Leptospira sp. 201903070]|uniref:Uncharacterized protein n=2 Tax=Leptospira ainlahdjerensis TaxID=2810033 RepID=A0ABS2UHG5_9LEPT|nr:hypothetical protein [Leptospira ainlahdjerensis]MBM9578315.1 hypothetical protein [Leptospira ainlahdjerensis]
MIISWDKIRHPHPKEEWKELLGKVDSFVEEGNRGSSRIFFERTLKKSEVPQREGEERGSSYFYGYYRPFWE